MSTTRETMEVNPPSRALLVALDDECQANYGAGATAVWRSLGVGHDLPNEAIHDETTGFYVIRPKPVTT